MQLHVIIPLVASVFNVVGTKQGEKTALNAVDKLSDKEKRKLLKEVRKNKK